MPETCPYCGKEFANTKALGSHIHYMHRDVSAPEGRSEEDEKRFRQLLDSCMSESGLRRPRQVERIEQAIAHIPEGVSAALDRYRNVFRCAFGKEKLLREIEELLDESNAEESG